MKKLPIIGILIGAIAAIFIKKKIISPEPEPEAPGKAGEDTSPPA